MQTIEGAKRMVTTMVARHGSYKNYCAWMAVIGAKGGKLGHTGGFYANRELARRAGRIGGSISKRTRKESNV